MEISLVMKREPNFEVMRTVAMLFIVVYHCLTHGVGDGYGFSVGNPVTLFNLLFSDFLLVFKVGKILGICLFLFLSHYHIVHVLADRTFQYCFFGKELLPNQHRCLLVCDTVYWFVNPFAIFSHVSQSFVI